MTGAGPAAPGRLLGGRYHLDSLIARGGMAEVWSATDQVLGRAVAVKVLHPHLADDDALRARFHNEAVAVARLVHPSIVAIFDTCGEGRTEAIVMELVRGRTLRDFLDERGRLDAVEVVHIGAEVASALACAHRSGIVHRDVKPANILLSDDGRVLVTDFGIAKVLDAADVTLTSNVLGTVKYLAPEQVEGGPIDARTDVYALGAVLYECVTGSPPFVGDSQAAVAVARLHRSPEPPSALEPDVPDTLDAVLVRALARRPDDRFASADDLRAGLLATRLQAPSDPTVVVPEPLTHDAHAAPGVSRPSPLAGTTVPLPPSAPWSPVGPSTRPSPSASPGGHGEPPGPGPWGGATPSPADPRAPRQRRRPTAALVLGLLATAALVVVALLVASTGLGRDLFTTDPPSPTATSPAPPAATAVVTSITSFDPEGTGTPGENDELAANVLDGDPATAWRTEQYSNRAFGNLKDGVGLVLSLDRPRPVDRIHIASPDTGWAVQVFVSSAPAADLAGWGAPVAEAGDVDHDAVLALDDAEGSHVLVWFTDLGASGGNRLTVHDITVET